MHLESKYNGQWLEVPGDSQGRPQLSVPDGANTVEGSTTDAAVTGDNAGTLSAKLRGLSKILASVWDGISSLFVTGNVAAYVADSGNPLKMGGLANTTPPAAASNGQRQNVWVAPNGQVVIAGVAYAATDNLSRYNYGGIYSQAGGSMAGLNAFMQASNGTTVDSWRNNMDVTLLADAVRSATTNSADQTNYNGRGVIVFLNIAAASGTGGLKVALQMKDPATGNYITLAVATTAVSTTGQVVYTFYPGATATSTQSFGAVLPRTWRVQVVHQDSSNYEYSVGASVII